MHHCLIKSDSYTYSIVLPCCDFEFGKQVHAEVVKVFSLSDEFLGTNLLRMYLGARDMDLCGMGDVGVELFRQMGIERVIVDDYTYGIVLNEFAFRSQVFEAM
ncbi:hypothetical protein LOK49_LG14G00771 [Camellia lanceoleosa]|uniref:Uncharacterized protein n=1 Tax=Camellia lanceoleosa TaxID=1840588 RepID=A0ACC0FD23_9ERIC|nr:hypothetical protein LOK49_LG14G00771 [Camellia lanceoleosa]